MSLPGLILAQVKAAVSTPFCLLPARRMAGWITQSVRSCLTISSQCLGIFEMDELIHHITYGRKAISMQRWNTKGLMSTLLLAALLALALMTGPAFAQGSGDTAVEAGTAASDDTNADDGMWYSHMWNGMQTGMDMMGNAMRGAAGTGMHMFGSSTEHAGPQHMGAGMGRHAGMHQGGMHQGGTMTNDAADAESSPCPEAQAGNGPQACPWQQ